MARVLKIARGKSFLARGFKCSPILFISLPDQGLYIVQNMYV